LESISNSVAVDIVWCQSLPGGPVSFNEIRYRRHTSFTVHSTGLSPFHYAWDSILIDPTNDKRKQRLLELFPQEEGGLDERQFTRLHKCILDLIGTKIDQELEISTALIDVQDNVGRTPLYWAARRGDSYAVKLLLQHGANPLLSSAKTNWKNPLHAAAFGGHAECLSALLATGMPINIRDAEGMTAFHYAASKSDDAAACVTQLLDGGADINEGDNDKRTAFLMAAQNGHLDIARILLERGADKDLPEIGGWTPLQSCIFWNTHQSIKFCLHIGTDTLQRTNEGDTLLHVTAQYADLDTIKILTDSKISGLDPNAMNDAKESPLDVAAARKDEADWYCCFETLLHSFGEINSGSPVDAKSSVIITNDPKIPDATSHILVQVAEVDDSDDDLDNFEDALEVIDGACG
jgi:ankyrin repeat protein